MIFGKGERRRTERTSNENLPKSAEIAAFWQGSYYSCPAYSRRTQTVRKIDKIYYITPKIRKKAPFAYAIIVAGG